MNIGWSTRIGARSSFGVGADDGLFAPGVLLTALNADALTSPLLPDLSLPLADLFDGVSLRRN